MSDARFRELLGLEPGASREQIRRSWRRRVMENHPDRFPPDRKPLQELRLIALSEAYASLMALSRDAKLADPASGGIVSGSPPAAGPAAMGRPAAAAGAIGPHRDPAYAYYKQGFL